MKRIRFIFLAALLAASAGCATTVATTGSQTSSADTSDDGIIRQKSTFKDLPAETQLAILHSGGGD
ncbi:MAG: hypothetical protein ED859_16330 [Desulfuromonadales bacterium]|nr:MAG: hypothetical protein ED859_16330 [Desulfuromonadales bacterium]